MAKEKTFEELQVGDTVVVFDNECSHDYIEHTIKITSKEEDPEEWGTETNPRGIHFYGDDLDYDEDEDYITNVHEGNFICVV